MTRLVVVAAAAIGLILFVAYVVSRLLLAQRRGTSIRLQIFLALSLIVGTFAFGLGLMVIDRIEARAVRLADQAARDEASTLAGMLEGELERTGLDVHALARRLELERARGADLRLELLGPSGEVVFPAGAPSGAGAPGTVYVDAPLEVRGRHQGAVRVVKPTVVMRALLEDFAPTVLVISLVLGAAAAVSSAFIGRAISKPIEALTAFAERVSQGERTAPPPVVFGREVRNLARSLDSMRRQLEGRPFVETFAADLSHELKNPVAAIRASAELLEEGALAEPEEALRFVRRIRESTERIERLLSELLDLARIDARGVESFEPVDLVELVRRTVSAHDAAARVELEADAALPVRGDAAWLARLLGNLLDNALVHGSEGAPVTLRLRKEDGLAVLRIGNAGKVERHVRQRLFRRFVTTRGAQGGTGLGLAIVRAVAEAHGGTVELTQAGPPRVEWTVRLPLAA